MRGLGLDIIEIARIERIWGRYGSRFASRILHPGELAALPESPVLFLAGRFAVKEAASKALGTGFAHGVTPVDMETVREQSGAPALRLHGAAARRMAEIGASRVYVSITHSRGVAAAVVVLE